MDCFFFFVLVFLILYDFAFGTVGYLLLYVVLNFDNMMYFPDFGGDFCVFFCMPASKSLILSLIYTYLHNQTVLLWLTGWIMDACAVISYMNGVY